MSAPFTKEQEVRIREIVGTVLRDFERHKQERALSDTLGDIGLACGLEEVTGGHL